MGELAKLVIATADSIDLEHVDLIAAVLQNLTGGIHQAEQRLGEHRQKEKQRLKTAARLKNKKGGPNILAQFFEGDARQHRAGAAKMEWDLEVAKEMMAILREHEYEFAPRGPQSYSANVGFQPGMGFFRR
jgi:hypothetical protein